MAKKRKTLPAEIRGLLEGGDSAALREQFLRCEPNAVTGSYGSNIFSLSPLPREFALWAKEQGADVNFVDHYGRTPLFNQASAWNGDARLLIELGADVAASDHSGVTPLHWASLYGRAEAVRALLDAGAEVGARSGRLDLPGFLTPLEKTLLQDRLPYQRLLEICRLLLENGAEITPRCREALSKSAERFQRNKRAIADPAFLRQQIRGLEQLCALFGVAPAAEALFHDGVSPIRLPEEQRDNAFSWLWNYLVPPVGKAPTAQGEALRIAGRVDHEITANGGMNWDGDYRKMLAAFPRYLRLGSPLGEEDLRRAETLARLLQSGRDDGALTTELCAYAVAWVLLNPDVLPPLGADYAR